MFRFLRFAVLLAVCAVSVHLYAADPDAASLLASLQKPDLGVPGTVSNLEIVLSPNMKVRLTSGMAAPVMAGSGRIGLFFIGNGTFEYTTADKSEATNVRFEARKAADAKVTASGDKIVITRDFEQLLLRSGGIALPEVGAGAGTRLNQAWPGQLEQSARIRGTVPAQLLARQILDLPASPVAVAEFAGGGDPMMYVLDSIDQREETLYALVREKGIDSRELASYFWPVVISRLATGRNRREFLQPTFLLTAIDFTLVADEKENAKLTVIETLLPRTAAQRVFRMDLLSAFYDTKLRTRQYKVTAVRDSAGKAVAFDHQADSIAIVLPAKAAPGDAVNVTFEIEGNVLHHPNGDNFWQLGVEPWFPQPDLNGQYYTVHSLVKVKKPFTAFAPGETIRRVEEGDYNVVENRIDKPVQFTVVHAGKYISTENTYDDGMTIRVACYALNNERAAKQLNSLAHKLIKFYEPWLGPFPWKEFNIIEINSLGFGQAPPATMFITKEAFNPLQGTENQAYSKGVNQRFAHEIAHQYWGHVVKMGTEEEQWITEAFAEYSSALAMREMKGKGEFDSLLATWKANANESKSISSIALANRIRTPGDYMGYVHRTHLVYDKGAFVLAALNKEVGDKKFLIWLRNLQHLFEWRFVTTQDAAKLLQRIDEGKDYMPFFEQYYWGTEMPKM